MTSTLLIIATEALRQEIAAAASRRGFDAQIQWLDVERPDDARLLIEIAGRAAGDARPIVIADSSAAADPTAAAVVAGLRALPGGRVFGFGTVALSAEFRRRIAARLTIDPRDVHATIVGGDAEAAVPLWSSATVAGIPLHQWAVMGHGKMTVRDRIDIFLGLKESFADEAYARAANASACIDIVEAIVSDSNRVLTVSSRIADYHGIKDAWLALPCIVNAKGAEPPLGVPMNDAEIAGLRQVAGTRLVPSPGMPGEG